MKRILAIALMLGSGAAAFAQGTIVFGNQFGTTFIAPIYGVNPADPSVSQTGMSSLGKPAPTPPATVTVYGGPLLTGANYSLGLFVAANNVTDPTQFTLAGTIAGFKNNVNPAALPNGLANTPYPQLTVSGFGAGVTVNFIIAAWDNTGNAVTSWATLLTTPAYGASAVTLSGPLGGVDAANNVFIPPNTIGWNSFSLAQVPEPSTFAMVGMGLVSLLALRRRV